MPNSHPFHWIAERARAPVFVVAVVLTLYLAAALYALGSPLVTEAAPAGIVSFEFAGELAAARRMVDSWGPGGRIYAGLNLGLDNLYLMAYPLAIGLGCVLLSQRLAGRSRLLASAGIWLAWGLPLAGALDALENYSLIRILLGTELAYWAPIARFCAIPKFALVGLGLAYLLVGLLLAVLRPRAGE